ncbi:hypothetical protein [Nonomuraea sp. NPDC002799]
MPEFRIPAADLRLGDEVEMFDKDPINPLYRKPGSSGVYWQVAELFDQGMQEYLAGDDQPVRYPTIGAVLVRKFTRDDLQLTEPGWRDLLFRMKLSPGAEHITMTTREGFIKHHTVNVRRPAPTPEAEEFRKHLAD